MGALTESEIFDCMAENFRLAAGYCDHLARSPIHGPIYLQLRDSLRLLEGTCRQAAVWRQDTRWYDVGLAMAEAHKRAGGWLRGATDPDTGRKIKLASAHRFKCFTMLAANLRAAEAKADRLRTARTGRVGMILPDSYRVPGPTRRTASGLILPGGMA